ncbi:MAG: hypothetical protein KatS3mg013_1234 [Actinomycetota bacterium]|nr:MAG: hypothetical protein KatS3mg013_1234 [Actinomycetota bacterium]
MARSERTARGGQGTSATVRRRIRRGKPGPPPTYDPAAVGRVARCVDILGVELLGAHFDRADDDPLPREAVGEQTPDIGISVEWSIDDDQALLGCALTFGTVFEGRPPYTLVARFRLLYSVKSEERLRRSDIEQFAHWNAVFNAWPYWREYLASTLNRAQLPRFVAPVMRVPMPDAQAPS